MLKKKSHGHPPHFSPSNARTFLCRSVVNAKYFGMAERDVNRSLERAQNFCSAEWD